MNRQELLEFNDAAMEIYLGCPQSRVKDSPFEDRDILLGNESEMDVLERWCSGDNRHTQILFDKGYLEGAFHNLRSEYDIYIDGYRKFKIAEATETLATLKEKVE